MRRLRHWIPALVWAAAIFLFSTQAFDAGATAGFLFPLLERLLPGASVETLVAVHLAIRKAAHFVEYFILSLLVYRGVRGEERGWQARWAWWTFALAAGYAALDELHQAFVPLRDASVRDVLLDSAGAAAALLLLWWRARRKSAPALEPK